MTNRNSINYIRAAPTGMDDDGNSGIGTYFAHNVIRSFSEIMLDWQASHQTTFDDHSFLKKTLLDELLTPAEWQQLCLGKVAPSAMLSNLLIATMLADEAYLNHSGINIHRKSYTAALSAADRARNDRRQVDTRRRGLARSTLSMGAKHGPESEIPLDRAELGITKTSRQLG